MKKPVCLLIAISILASTSLFADINLGLYEQSGQLDQNGKVNLQDYIGAVGKGIFWANGISEAKGNPLYCQPKKLALSQDDYILILDQEIKNNSYSPNSPIEMILCFGLMHNFPCQNKK